MTYRELEEIEAHYRDPYNCTHPNATADILRLIAEVRILKAQLEHIDHEWTRGVHSSGWGGAPVTNEQPPDRSEDGINERFFEAK